MTDRPQDTFDLDRWFDDARTRGGSEYLAARARVLEHPVAARPLLDRKAQSSDWREAWVARSLLGWLDSVEEYTRAREILEERGLPPVRNILGKHQPPTIAKFMAAIGPAIAPWLYETLFKTRDFTTERQESVLYLAVEEVGDASMIPPLLERVEDRVTRPLERSSALRSALRLEAASGPGIAQATAVRLLQNPQEPDELRGAAAKYLVAMPPEGLLQTLESIVQDPTTSARLTEDIVWVFSELADPSVRPTLHTLLDGTNNEELIGTLFAVLARLGDRTSLTRMKAAQTRTEDPNLYDEWIEDLEQRLQNEPSD